MPILSNLSEQQLFQLAGRMANREYGSGQEVFRKGEEGDTFYIVEEGTFRWGGGQMIKLGRGTRETPCVHCGGGILLGGGAESRGFMGLGRREVGWDRNEGDTL